MFKTLILKKCNEWYKDENCPITSMIEYIQIRGSMRDAQFEAIKIYLFLKIECKNKPLWKLFSEGKFNSIDLNEEPLKTSTRDFLLNNTAAAALYECCLNNKNDKNIEKIKNTIINNPESIKYEEVFKNIFYNVSYSDYIFSLPMGAGKTFLMAAFIYLDLYFSSINPNNNVFAENFIVLAPNGLKKSIIPSLKTIRDFNPEWILDPVIANSLKKEIIFEPLEAESSKTKSNKAKNPNARKVAMHLQPGGPRGLVLVTNAEKVILNKIKNTSQKTIGEITEDEEEKLSNELRSLIGKIPKLSIFIDEVHHASDDSIKLRSVVNKWAANNTVITVLGFSGTPYLQSGEKIHITDNINIVSNEINNVVYFYPLINGIGNFLKIPELKRYENREKYLEIVDDGLKLFFDKNITKKYNNELWSKIAIYCNNIEELEEEVYPKVREIVKKYGLNPDEVILRYHEDKKGYKLSDDAEYEFSTLDLPQSKIRVILLVQIGKEGWDCRSLTGVILAKENKSTRNMVLQTCCRCLRQVKKYDKEEKAYIYLCKSNYDILEKQLKVEQQITIKEFQTGKEKKSSNIRLYNRKEIIELPRINFFQYEINTKIVKEEEPNIRANIKSINIEDMKIEKIITTTNIEGKIIKVEQENSEHGDEYMDVANFNYWLGEIAKEGFKPTKRKQLIEYKEELKEIFDAITFEKEKIKYFSTKFDRKRINSLIRQAFYTKRHVDVTAEYVPESAELLKIANFIDYKDVYEIEKYYPKQEVVLTTINDDKNGFENREYMKRRYHYMPYHLDSGFELKMLNNLHGLIKDKELELYYNGDRFLTDFHISCYEQIGTRWKSIGKYTPDFLLIKRKNGEIQKAIIIETKGQIYASDPTFKNKKVFVNDYFIKKNNELWKYEKFKYIYIEDTMSETEQMNIIMKAVKDFFEV